MDAKLIVYNKEYPLVTEESMTLGEAADAEEITGQGYDLSQGGSRALLALAYISMRRLDPSIKIEDIRLITAEDLEVVLPEGDDAVLPPENSADSDAGATSNGESSPPDSADTPAATPEASGVPS